MAWERRWQAPLTAEAERQPPRGVRERPRPPAVVVREQRQLPAVAMREQRQPPGVVREQEQPPGFVGRPPAVTAWESGYPPRQSEPPRPASREAPGRG